MEYALERAPVYRLEILLAFLLDINSGSIRLLEKYGFSRWGHFPEIARFDEITCGQFVYGKHLLL